MPPLGAPPTYSTPVTLVLALLAIVTALWHFSMGALDYSRAGRYVGLGLILLAGLTLVYGVLMLIRYVEARDAMSDPHPRTPMYVTPHEGRVPVTGVVLGLALLAADVAFTAASQTPGGHIAGLMLAALLARQALKARPERGE